MYLIYGSRTFGKVDEIKGLGHVATEFGHIFWFPLVPKETLFVTNKKWNGVEGVPIPMSGKSVGAAYLRAVALLLSIAALGAAKTLFAPEAGEVIEPDRLANMKVIMIMGIFALPTYLASLTGWFTQADYETATALVAQTGLGHEAQVVVDLQYGKIDEVEAAERLENGPTAVQQSPEYEEAAACGLESAKYLHRYANS